jgi:hypothetical protein
MTLNRLWGAALVALVLTIGSVQPFAQPPAVPSLTGNINDYPTAGGGWHVNGEWTLRARGASGRADFIASLAMVRSDFWVLNTPADPAARSPHTHHAGLLNASVTVLPNGIRLSGVPIITTNGSAAFPASTMVVEITGGDLVQYSNVSITFAGQAAGHFGGAPLDGVVLVTR